MTTEYADAHAHLFRSSPRTAAGWTTAVVALLLLAGGATQALGAEASPAGSTEPHATPMDEIELSTHPPGQVILPKPEEEKAFPFFDDATVSAQLRSFYFNRDQYSHATSEAWAVGGWLAFRSGYLANLLRVGAAFYTSQPIYAPEHRDGTLLLKPGQENYTVLGQLYGEVKIADRLFAAVGRKEYDTPYLNKNDVRMTPNTFEGITMYGRAGGQEGAPEWRFGGGYITKIKERNSDTFVWLSTDAGSTTAHRGAYILGANMTWGDFSFGAIDYFSDDIINIAYSEAKYAVPLGDAVVVKLAGQFTDQRSTGNELLMGTDFSTRQWGVKSDVVVGPATLTVAFTDTGAGANMQNPWSGYPGYTSVQVLDFNRADESAVMLRAAYDLSTHGLTGVSTYALWVHGYGREAPASDEDEIDFNVQWTPEKTGPLRGMSFRTRYAYMSQRGGGDPNQQDFRFIVNYDFPRPE